MPTIRELRGRGLRWELSFSERKTVLAKTEKMSFVHPIVTKEKVCSWKASDYFGCCLVTCIKKETVCASSVHGLYMVFRSVVPDGNVFENNWLPLIRHPAADPLGQHYLVTFCFVCFFTFKHLTKSQKGTVSPQNSNSHPPTSKQLLTSYFTLYQDFFFYRAL